MACSGERADSGWATTTTAIAVKESRVKQKTHPLLNIGHWLPDGDVSEEFANVRRRPATQGARVSVVNVIKRKRDQLMKSNRTILSIAGYMLCCSLTMSAQGQSTFSSADGKSMFSYSGDTGPGFWDEINSACAATSTSRQSPIDIDEVKVDRDLRPLDAVLG